MAQRGKATIKHVNIAGLDDFICQCNYIQYTYFSAILQNNLTPINVM